MRGISFPGGIHPPALKEETGNKPIEKLPAPHRVVIPLKQHTGTPCRPLVGVGHWVKEGERIGESTAFISAPVHSSICGEVKAVEPHPHPSGMEMEAVVIEGDGGDEKIKMEEVENWASLSPEEIRKRVREGGVVGLGGAAFPTAVKLSPPPDKKIDFFILNGAECEPYLSADHRLMVEQAEEIVEGMEIMMHALQVPAKTCGGLIAIEKNKPDALEIMEKAVEGRKAFEIAALKTKYPQGCEKQLIQAILHREVPSGGLPFDVGVVVNNVATALAVREAVVLGKPLIERVITVAGPGVRMPKNLKVRIGTPFSEVIDFCQGKVEKGNRVIMGGPMMGIAQYTTDVPVVKGTSGILIFPGEEEKTGPCLNCGFCVESCPLGLIPSQIARYIEEERFEEAKDNGLLDCMECGSCAYVCPAGKQLIQLIQQGKAVLAKKPL